MGDKPEPGLFGGLKKAFGLGSKHQQISEEEIKTLVGDADELLEDEKRMISDILSLNDMSVSEPRVSVPALTAEETAENAILMPIMLKRPAAPSEAVALREFVAAATITVASATSRAMAKNTTKAIKLPLNFKSPSGSSDAPPLTRSAKRPSPVKSSMMRLTLRFSTIFES